MSNSQGNLTFPDVKCPICGNTIFRKRRSAKPDDTVFLCGTGRGDDIQTGKPSCRGVACYCKKCEKYYPETNFGFHSGAYECKTCGAVQWDYTDMKKNQKELEALTAQIRLKALEYM